MGKNIKNRILDSIGKICDVSQGCKLEKSALNTIEEELKIVSEYFHTTKEQSLFIAIIFANEPIYFNSLVDYLECSIIDLLKYNDSFELLISLGIICHYSEYIHRNNNPKNLREYRFRINPIIVKSILSNKPIPKLNKKQYTVFDFLEKVSKIIMNDDFSDHQLFYTIKELIDENMNFPLVEQIKKLNLREENVCTYLFLIHSTIKNYEEEIEDITDQIFSRSKADSFLYAQNFLSGDNELIEKDLVQFDYKEFGNETILELTEKSKQMLVDSNITILRDKNNKKENVILPETIPARELIFSKSQMEQLFTIQDLLVEPKFSEIQKRLTKKNLAQGINILLHGYSGTGKTEFVKQIAKKTNRLLIKVEISNSKSVWFGESEKKIKRIFQDYNSILKTAEQTPILLFNEADAIISKRTEVGISSVSKTENTIQNILLEELENFNGILIATTNLTQNIDSAFERRFLFKVNFEKPNADIRAKIWKSKLPFLNLEDCLTLAESFIFTGGQIDNIVRKCEIQEIIYGKKVVLKDILLFCSEETLLSNRVKVGFNQ